LTLSVRKPVPSALILSCVSGSGTRFTVTRIFTGGVSSGGNSGTETGLRYNGGHSQSRKRVADLARVWQPGGLDAARRESTARGGLLRRAGGRGTLAGAHGPRTGRSGSAPRPIARRAERQLASRFPTSKPRRLDRSRPAFTTSGASSLSMRSAWKRYAGPTMASAPTTLRV